MVAKKRIYEINGKDFRTLEEFYDVISRTLIPGTEWGKNLDAFNDILRGGFGTPDGGFIIRWINSNESKKRLGHSDYDWLLEIIRKHGTGGSEAEDGIELVLE